MIRMLGPDDKDIVRGLFTIKKFMGVDKEIFESVSENFEETAYEMFCEAFLSNLSNFHAIGHIDDKTGMCTAYISFYQSDDEPAWYFTMVRSNAGKKVRSQILDAVIEYNEQQGRYKWYMLINIKHGGSVRRFGYGEFNELRYDSYDEAIIPANTKPLYNSYWEILAKRSLIPVDSLVRCCYLKKEFRKNIPICGNI